MSMDASADRTTGISAGSESEGRLTERRPEVIESPPPVVVRRTGRPGRLDDGLVLEAVSDGPLFLAAERFLYEVYRDSEFCAESPRQMVEELDEWRVGSRFHLVHDEDLHVLGSVRTIFGRIDELPIGAFDLDLSDRVGQGLCCELSSLAVAPSSRSSGIIEHIYRAGWLAAWRAGALDLVALVDDWLLEVFTDVYGLPFRPIGRSHFHMGGDVIPVAMALQGPAYENLARTRPAFWEWTLEACSDEEMVAWSLPPVGGSPDS